MCVVSWRRLLYSSPNRGAPKRAFVIQPPSLTFQIVLFKKSSISHNNVSAVIYYLNSYLYQETV